MSECLAAQLEQLFKLKQDGALTQEEFATKKAALIGGDAAPAMKDARVELFGEKLVGKDGMVKTADFMAGKKYVLVYFSGHWCPPCRGFTPVLAKAYKESSKAGSEVGVVFVSSDRDQASFDEYYGEMPWHALPYSERGLKAKLSEQFSVEGIPMLIVLDAEGKLVTAEGRAKYTDYLSAGGKPVKASVTSADFSIENGKQTTPQENSLMYKGKVVADGFFVSYYAEDDDYETYGDITIVVRDGKVSVQAMRQEIGADRPGMSYRGVETLQLGTLEGEIFTKC